MKPMPSESEVLDKLVAWGEGEETIRAMLITSSRTRPMGPVDELSDYDIVLVVTEAFDVEGGWSLAYGTPLVRWGMRM